MHQPTLFEDRVSWVRLDWIDASPFQVRRVFSPETIEALADSILATGLIHPPLARPGPRGDGHVELMPGELRVRALRVLVARGCADALLRRDAEGHWLGPIVLTAVDDDAAEATVFAENDERTDLSAWEIALAWQARRDRRRARRLPAGVRDLASAYGKKHQTVAPYLAVADALTREILVAADVAGVDGEPDHERLARLPLAALQRVSRAAAAGATAGAERLLRELARNGDPAAAELLAARAKALRGEPRAPGLQVNIRQPLASVPARQAVVYLVRLAPAVAALSRRAVAEAAGGEDELRAVAEELAAAVATLRGNAISSPAAGARRPRRSAAAEAAA